jgi:hypothetical protein
MDDPETLTRMDSSGTLTARMDSSGTLTARMDSSGTLTTRINNPKTLTTRMGNLETLATPGTQNTGQIKVRENQRGNQEWTMQRH